MIAKLASQGEIGSGSESRKCLEVVDEMGLVEIATGQGEICHTSRHASFQRTQDFLKALDATKLFWGESYSFTEHLDEAGLANTDPLRHCRNGWET